VRPIAIVGAGPAGCAAARLLAGWGHRVVLIDRGGDDRRVLAESIPPSTDRVLAALGMLTSIQDARFHPWRGNTVWWGTREPRVETFAPGAAGYQVRRSALDARLRQLAVEAGAELRPGLVRHVDVGGAVPVVDVAHDGTVHRVEARVVLDCSGRSGAIARPDFRRATSGHRTIALAAVWTASSWPIEGGDSHTWVASYADGWAWSVPTDAHTRYVTLMVDPARSELTRGRSSREIYLRELGKVRPFEPALARATLADGPWGADASPYDAREYARPSFLLVGDAGSFIDPLSSFGVKKALASGWLAAIVVHTMLSRPEMTGHAIAFFNRREREVFAVARRQAAAFTSSSAGHPETPFWLARASNGDDAHSWNEIDVATLARDPTVLAAFDDLRRRAGVQLSRGASARVESRAAVQGREIVLQDQLLLPDAPEGVRFLRGIDLLKLMEIAPARRDVGEICEAISREQQGVSLPDILGALSLLIARDVLQHSA
jgi:flavin-dependent dehydrogenase